MKMMKKAWLVTALIATPQLAAADFYKRDNSPDIYLTYGNNEICRVDSPQQLEAWGGGSIRNVSANANLFAGRKNRGTCGWPNGFYRQINGAIYRIRGREVCHVVSPDQLKALGGENRLRNIGRGNIMQGKKNRGDCAWP